MTHARPALNLLAALIALAATATASAADPLLEDRLARIERIMENQSASGLMLQQQQLQQELQELRGLVESQQFEIQKMQRQLRDQYLDIDSRLGAGKGPDSPPAGAPTLGHQPRRWPLGPRHPPSRRRERSMPAAKTSSHRWARKSRRR